MVTSPAIGFAARVHADRRSCTGSFRRAPRRRTSGVFRRLQVGSAGFMAFSHGSNDAQKTMGIITLALFSAGLIESVDRANLGDHRVGHGALAGDGRRRMADHAYDGSPSRQARAGPRLCRGDDRGQRPVHDRPAWGCRSRPPMSSRARSWGSVPARGVRGVRWGVARGILLAWIITIPAAGFVAALAWIVLNAIGLG